MNKLFKDIDCLSNDELWKVVEYAQNKLKNSSSKQNRHLISTQPEVDTQDAFQETKLTTMNDTDSESLNNYNEDSFLVLETKFLKVEDIQQQVSQNGMTDLKRKLIEIDNLINAPAKMKKLESKPKSKNGMTLKTELYSDTQNSNIGKCIKIAPFQQFDPSKKVDEKGASYYPNVLMVDELIEEGMDTLPTELSKEDLRKKNLAYFLRNHKDIPDYKRLTLNYNPVRLMPWRIQDFKINENSKYVIEKEFKKTKKYWENHKQWGKYKPTGNDFHDKYFKNFYLYFDNMKNVENPLRSIDRISYPSTIEMKQDKYYSSVYEYNECKKMLLLALNGSIPKEERGYIFREDLLNQLVDSGHIDVDFDTLVISYMKDIIAFQ